jgi:hypothetical protein
VCGRCVLNAVAECVRVHKVSALDVGDLCLYMAWCVCVRVSEYAGVQSVQTKISGIVKDLSTTSATKTISVTPSITPTISDSPSQYVFCCWWGKMPGCWGASVRLQH